METDSIGNHYRLRYGPGNTYNKSGKWEIQCSCGALLTGDTARKASNAGDRHMASIFGKDWKK